MNLQLTLFEAMESDTLTFSQADTPANHFHTQGDAKERTIRDTSGLTCSELLRKRDPLGFLERTLRDTLPLDSMKSSMTWKQRVTKQGHSYIQLVRSKRRTKDTVSSSSDTGESLWRTPQACNATQGPKSKEFYERCLVTGESSITLTDQVRHHSGMWPTPQARDWKGPQGRAYLGGAEDLPSMVLWPTPTSRDYKDTGDCANVPTNALLGREVHPSKAEGSLNPDWEEQALMGFPPGWTIIDGEAVPTRRRKSGSRQG